MIELGADKRATMQRFEEAVGRARYNGAAVLHKLCHVDNSYCANMAITVAREGDCASCGTLRHLLRDAPERDAVLNDAAKAARQAKQHLAERILRLAFPQSGSQYVACRADGFDLMEAAVKQLDCGAILVLFLTFGADALRRSQPTVLHELCQMDALLPGNFPLEVLSQLAEGLLRPGAWQADEQQVVQQVSWQSRSGAVPLHVAAMTGAADAVRQLIDVQRRVGRARSAPTGDVAAYVLGHGAVPRDDWTTAHDNDGDTPAEWAVLYGHPRIAAEIVAEGSIAVAPPTRAWLVCRASLRMMRRPFGILWIATTAGSIIAIALLDDALQRAAR